MLYPYTKGAGGNIYFFTSESSNTEYEVRFWQDSEFEEPTVHVDFRPMMSDEVDDPWLDLTGDQTIRIFSTVVAIVEEYLGNTIPFGVVFKASNRKRAQLYQKMLVKLEKKLNTLGYYKRRIVGKQDGTFTYTLKNADLAKKYDHIFQERWLAGFQSLANIVKGID